MSRHKTTINFGDGVRIFYQNKEIAKWVFKVREMYQEIEIIQLEKHHDIEIKIGIDDF